MSDIATFSRPEDPMQRTYAPSMARTHDGSHGAGCFGCKLVSLHFDTGAPKTHNGRKGPWEGNPVKERIEELSGITIDTDAMSRR